VCAYGGSLSLRLKDLLGPVTRVKKKKKKYGGVRVAHLRALAAPTTDRVQAPTTDRVQAPTTDRVQAPTTDRVQAPTTDRLQRAAFRVSGFGFGPSPT